MMKIKEEEEIKLNPTCDSFLEVYERRNHQRSEGINLPHHNRVRWTAGLILSPVRSATMVQSSGSRGGGESE